MPSDDRAAAQPPRPDLDPEGPSDRQAKPRDSIGCVSPCAESRSKSPVADHFTARPPVKMTISEAARLRPARLQGWRTASSPALRTSHLSPGPHSRAVPGPHGPGPRNERYGANEPNEAEGKNAGVFCVSRPKQPNSLTG